MKKTQLCIALSSLFFICSTTFGAIPSEVTGDMDSIPKAIDTEELKAEFAEKADAFLENIDFETLSETLSKILTGVSEGLEKTKEKIMASRLSEESQEEIIDTINMAQESIDELLETLSIIDSKEDAVALYKETKAYFTETREELKTALIAIQTELAQMSAADIEQAASELELALNYLVYICPESSQEIADLTENIEELEQMILAVYAAVNNQDFGSVQVVIKTAKDLILESIDTIETANLVCIEE